MRTLRVTTGPAAGTVVDVEGDVVIGREDADLTIADPQISRRHTVVRPVERGVEIEDLGSLNGTFVDGERLEAPRTLTSPATLRVGDSAIEIEIEPEIEIALEPEPEDSSATKLATPPPPPPPPSEGEPRGVVRRVEPEPVPAASPSTAATNDRPEVEPARTPLAATRAPAVPSLDAAARRRKPLAVGLTVGLLGVAAAAVAAFLLLGGDNGETTHRLVASVDTALLEQTAERITVVGTVSQSPGGTGTVVTRLTVNGELRAGEPVPVTGAMVFRFEGGRIDATVKGTATQRKDETTDLALTGTITSGTREFEGATGSYRLQSAQDPLSPTVGHPTINGTITY